MVIIKQELIEPFAKSGKDLLLQILNLEVKEEESYIVQEIKTQNYISVIIGLSGFVKGWVIINYSEEIGKKIASSMMNWIPIIILDDQVKNSICEISTMIVGNAIAKIYDSGVAIDLIPPILVYGEDISYNGNHKEITCLPFKIQNERVEINILIIENN